MYIGWPAARKLDRTPGAPQLIHTVRGVGCVLREGSVGRLGRLLLAAARLLSLRTTFALSFAATDGSAAVTVWSVLS
ncbi:hypothetical protein SALBM311S_11159 [Streptomyces alboniger]